MNCTPFVRQYDILSNKWGAVHMQVIIAIFKNKANVRRNESNLNSQKAKQSEKHIGLHQEEHRESVP